MKLFNSGLRKAIGIACVCGLTLGLGISQPAKAAQSLYWQNPGAVISQGTTTFLPVRDIMSQAGVQVQWISTPSATKLVLENGQGRFEIPVNMSTGQVSVGEQAFPYSLANGRLALPISFYGAVLQNQGFSWDSKNKAFVLTADPAADTLIPTLSPYAEEAKPAAAPEPQGVYYESGQATWYGAALHGNYTASGERFNMYDLTAAHKTLPFGTRVKVTNMNNGLSVVVRITDRGPFAPGRVIDLSKTAAEQVQMVSSGVAPVKLEVLK